MRVEKPVIVEKPWGKEIFLCCNDRYIMEIMEIKKGGRTSLHYHENRMETFCILAGVLKVDTKVLHAGYVVTVMPKEIHRLEAIENVKVIEVSTPELNDIIRLQDDYGRI